MKNILRSKKVIFLSLILLVILSVWFLKRNHDAKPMMPEPVMVEVKKVKQGSIPIQAQAVGALVASQSVQITSEVAGQVAKILAQDGSYVKKGTPLIQLDDTIHLAKAESDQANLVFSEASYHRMVLLGKKGAISQQAIDQALADLKDKKAKAKESRSLADKMLLTAPFDGVLGKIKVSLGEHISVGQSLVSLTDTRNLRVEFNVSEKYFSLLKQGQKVILTTTAYPGKEFYGKLAYIAPIINTEDRTVSLYADVPNQNGLLTAGLFMNVKHLLGSEQNAFLIPAVSLIATIDGHQVYKVVNNKAVAVAVKLGQRTLDQVQITEGLTTQDTVVVSGQHKIKEGMPVKAMNLI